MMHKIRVSVLTRKDIKKMERNPKAAYKHGRMEQRGDGNGKSKYKIEGYKIPS